MKKLFLFLLLVLFLHQSDAQVTTRILTERENIKTYFPKHIDGKLNSINIEKPDLDAIYAEDERIGRQLARFAVKVNTDITEKDGEFIEQNDYMTWKISVFSEGATSLNFKFKNLILPDGAKMFLFSSDERMVIGPIISQNLRNGKIMTNMLYGNEAIIEVLLPKKDTNSFKLEIEFISYGIIPHSLNEIDKRAFDGSEWCIRENNIICPEFTDWYDLGGGVARILVYGQWWCSGSLVANECNADRPFFLTAFHCLDENFNGVLNGNELDDLENWCFEFDYESTTCKPSTEPSTTNTYCGADFLAAWDQFNGTDFLLLEINDPDPINNNLNIINHTSNINDTEVACIQHPVGDVKKIAIDDDGVTVAGNFWSVNQMDDGLMQHGSSGAPMFDSNHEIFGIHSHRSGNFSCESDGGSNNIDFFSGRMDLSWLGNGTNDSSLEPWLGTGTPPDMDNYASNQYPISGPDLVCDSAQFCSPGANSSNVHWQVSPQEAFYPPFEGYTTCANIKVRENFMGNATITFTSIYPYGYCAFEASIQKQFWVGKPDFTLEAETLLMCPRDRGVANIEPLGGWINPTFNWTFTGAISGTGSTVIGKYIANYPGTGYICAAVTNKCGSTVKCLEVLVEDCGRGGDRNFIVEPNPTDGLIKISLVADLYIEGELKNIRILDQYSKVYLETNTTLNSIEIDVSSFNAGLYIISLTDDSGTFSQQFIKL